ASEALSGAHVPERFYASPKSTTQSPSCRAVKILPAMITVPVRGNMLGDAFITLICTVPLPLPLAALMNTIQSTVEVAVQAHPGGVVTEMSKLLACRPNVCEVGVIE